MDPLLIISSNESSIETSMEGIYRPRPNARRLVTLMLDGCTASWSCCAPRIYTRSQPGRWRIVNYGKEQLMSYASSCSQPSSMSRINGSETVQIACLHPKKFKKYRFLRSLAACSHAINREKLDVVVATRKASAIAIFLGLHRRPKRDTVIATHLPKYKKKKKNKQPHLLRYYPNHVAQDSELSLFQKSK